MYTQTQKNFRKHPTRCIRSILDGPSNVRTPGKEIMVPFWRQRFTSYTNYSPGIDDTLRQDLRMLWLPIDKREITKFTPNMGSAPGPDGITPKQWRQIPIEIKWRIFNLILYCGRIPSRLLRATTTLIPKTPDADEPGQFHPITVSSILVRHINAILAARIRENVVIDERQRAFQPIDGCAINTVLLDLLMRTQAETFTSAHIAVLDVSKAYDSVSHQAIYDTLLSYGFPPEFVSYIESTYRESTTRLKCDGWYSEEIHPMRGVKQGDPLSPNIFNLVVDRVLRSLPAEVGAMVGEQKCGAIAFADDIVLAARTPLGLNTLLETTATLLRRSGLTLNPAKCRTVSLKGQPKQKNTVLENRTFKVDGRPIPTTTRADNFRYLGIPFDSRGRMVVEITAEHRTLLGRLTKAPLKPQQRMHALRIFVIPRLLHRASLGNIHLGVLRKIDILNRRYIRQWLDLPADVPNAYFHAAVSDGGLGVQSLRWQAPLVRRNRLLKIRLPGVCANTYLAREIDKASRRLRTDRGDMLFTHTDVNRMWRDVLYGSVDGGGLRESAGTRSVHRWIREPTTLLRAGDFINCVRVRINALPTRSRTARGRPRKDRACRAGCDGPETLNHILQQCPRTHNIRVQRHNAVVDFVATRNRAKHLIREPKLDTEQGTCKPDLIFIAGDQATVVDAQVVTDGMSLDEAHRAKCRKYGDSKIIDAIKIKYQVQSVQLTSITLNWRGVWSPASAADLLARDIVFRRDLAILSTRVLIGNLATFKVFNSSTMTYLPGRRRRRR